MDHQESTKSSVAAKARLRNTNKMKVFRTFIQLVALAVALLFGVFSLIKGVQSRAVLSDSMQEAMSAPEGTGKANQFIALAYPGLTKSESLESKIINQKAFDEQMAALKSAGYVTISQNDIVSYYRDYGRLPDKALFLIFGDGIKNTITLAQKGLEANHYLATVCTYVNALGQASGKFITASDLKSLKSNQMWEFGTNGYRLSYINVFDRYNNYFGHLNTDEFVRIYSYLWRDYNHYLMDFKRDHDRLRQETELEMTQRILKDYDLMESTYTKELGMVPGLYILMHANTSAFGNDPVASNANRDGLTRLFNMNFNRQGTSLNTQESSIYDLSRLEVQSYFSTNHLLMRIQDDTGDEMPFVIGDAQEAQKWYVDDGAAEFKGEKIILTTQPRGEGRMILKDNLLTNVDMTVTLQGNLIGSQSIYLRTDRSLQSGIQISLENNELVVREPSQSNDERFRMSLFEFDGGPFISEQEDEYNGLVALQNAVIQFDDDPERIAKAQQKLEELQSTQVLTLDQGGTPYYPVLDIAKRESRSLRIRLVGERLSIWVNDEPIVEQLPVTTTNMGAIALQSLVYYGNEYSQRFLYDDVYDAVFISPLIRSTENPDDIYYTYTLEQTKTINSLISSWFGVVVDFFVDNF